MDFAHRHAILHLSNSTLLTVRHDVSGVKQLGMCKIANRAVVFVGEQHLGSKARLVESLFDAAAYIALLQLPETVFQCGPNLDRWGVIHRDRHKYEPLGVPFFPTT